MVIVAFHYRLPADPLGQPEGCWREFDRFLPANAWLFKRQNKTPTSPKGGSVFTFKNLDDIPVTAEQWQNTGEVCPALHKAIVSYCRYKQHERK